MYAVEFILLYYIPIYWLLVTDSWRQEKRTGWQLTRATTNETSRIAMLKLNLDTWSSQLQETNIEKESDFFQLLHKPPSLASTVNQNWKFHLESFGNNQDLFCCLHPWHISPIYGSLLKIFCVTFDMWFEKILIGLNFQMELLIWDHCDISPSSPFDRV